MSASPAVFCAYFLSILNFYHQSHGFTKSHNQLYAFWKIVPIFILITFVGIDGAGISLRTRVLLVLALMSGAIGDFLIGLSPEGIVTGAIAFGIGHFFYMGTFVPDGPQVLWPLALILFASGGIVSHLCLLPMMNSAPIPVLLLIFYSLILTATLLFAASQCYYGTKKHLPFATNLQWRLLAFALFYVSDAMLIFTHTGYLFRHSEVFVLATYYAAQYLIVQAAIISEAFEFKEEGAMYQERPYSTQK